MVRVKFNPLNNQGTSRVFHELLLGVKTPNQIASSLQIKPPSAIEHLRRLQIIGLIRLGNKNGKFQNYEINKRRLAQMFLEEAPRSVKRRIRLQREYNFIMDNKHFQEMILRYIKNIYLYMPGVTLLYAIKDFEESLVRVYPYLKSKESIEDQEMVSLLTTLEEWYNDAKETFTGSQQSLYDAFKEMTLLTNSS